VIFRGLRLDFAVEFTDVAGEKKEKAPGLKTEAQTMP
jgi:hypothetical protein